MIKLFDNFILEIKNNGYYINHYFFDLISDEEINLWQWKKNYSEVDKEYDNILNFLKNLFCFEELIQIQISLLTYLRQNYSMRSYEIFISNIEKNNKFNEKHNFAGKVLNSLLISVNILLSNSKRTNEISFFSDNEKINAMLNKFHSNLSKILNLGFFSIRIDAEKVTGIDARNFDESYIKKSIDQNKYQNSSLPIYINLEESIKIFNSCSKVSYSITNSFLDGIEKNYCHKENDFDVLWIEKIYFLKTIKDVYKDKYQDIINNFIFKNDYEISFRTSLSEINYVAMPIVEIGDFFVISKSLIKYASDQYFTLLVKGSSQFKILKNEENYKQKFNNLYNQKFIQYVEGLFVKNQYKTYKREVMSTEWAFHKEGEKIVDYGDIDLVVYNENKKIVLFNEIKFIVPRFLNISNKFKTEDDWKKRQEQRLQKFNEYALSKFNCYNWFAPIFSNVALSNKSFINKIIYLTPSNLKNELDSLI